MGILHFIEIIKKKKKLFFKLTLLLCEICNSHGRMLVSIAYESKE